MNKGAKPQRVESLKLKFLIWSIICWYSEFSITDLRWQALCNLDVNFIN